MPNSQSLSYTPGSTSVSTMPPTDRGFFHNSAPDYLITRFKPGHVIWMHPKVVGTPEIVKVDKKGKISNLEYAGYDHPALILKQIITPGCLRVSETYIALQISSCGNMSLEEWLQARPARRDIKFSLPLDYRSSDMNWSLLDSHPEIPILRLQNKNLGLRNTKTGSYVKTNCHLEVAPVHVRRFHDLRPLHWQPRVSFTSFKKLLEFMGSKENAQQLYYGNKNGSYVGASQQSFPVWGPSTNALSFSLPGALTTQEGTSMSRSLQTKESKYVEGGSTNRQGEMPGYLAMQNGIMNGLGGVRRNGPNWSALEVNAGPSYNTYGYSQASSWSNANIQAFQTADYLQSQRGDLEQIIKAVEEQLKIGPGYALRSSPSGSKPTLLEFDKAVTVGIDNLTKSVLERVYKHYKIDKIALKRTDKVIIVAIPPSKVSQVFGKETVTIKVANEQVLSHCTKIVAALLGRGKPSNRVYGFKYTSMQILFVDKLVVCICSVEE